jgi:primase-polymerase (primpol)-like protein
MHTLPYQNNPELFPHLNAWFRYRASQTDGYHRLQNIWRSQQPFARHQPVTTEADYHPLTESEEKRWTVLERKARQENLSGQDSAEYEILLEIKLYNRYKTEYPQLAHEAILAFVKRLM